ncbi:hypothetical protein C0J52_06319 [Blattella germanica]|nr:hypothetical protein C0J52_06319 [Blattella germanica]
MALDGNKVVGACLSRVLTRDEVFNYVIPSELGPDDDPLNYNVVRMIVTLHRKLDLFAASDDNRILELGLCSVEPSHTGRGLASRLFRASLELGSAQGVQAAKADCTGPASAGGCRRAGMVAVCKLPYDEYQVNGNIVFNSPPGSYLSVMACRLQKTEPYVLPFHIPSKI